MDVWEVDLDTMVDELPVWDSVYLLRLLTVLEEDTGRALPMRLILEARTLEQIRTHAAGAWRTSVGGER
ncbi:acyl carrier protein [Streptomyces sp. E11-3]|uniref:acyl carrier protein n=1 Tax=Streptomyces sp. E11-3 TaxID=3110112 RepID=UPI003980FCB6